MLTPLSVSEIVEVFRRRSDLSLGEIAARMGWRPGTLQSYLQRLREGRAPTRDELDALGRGLTDPRFELGDPTVLRNHLYAAAGIAPTPQEVADFIATCFPEAPKDGTPSLVLDMRGFVLWVSDPLARLAERLGGHEARRVTALLHGWTSATGFVAGGDDTRDGSRQEVPEVFHIMAEDFAPASPGPLGPFHVFEAVVDAALGVNVVFGAGEDGDLPPSAVEQMARHLRFMCVIWPGFWSSPWYAPVDRRLSAFPTYGRAVGLATTPDDAARIPLGTSFTLEAPHGAILATDTVPFRDQRMILERFSPASRELWDLWDDLAQHSRG